MPDLGAPTRLRRAVVALALLAGWAAVAVPVAVLVFFNSSRTTVVASHEAVVSPAWADRVQVNLGPVLPSFRFPTGAPLGAEISLGKTSAVSYDELVQRYALLAGNPEGQVDKVQTALADMAVAAALTGTLAGLAVPGLWLLLGPRRRAELAGSRRAVTVLAGVAVLGVAAAGAVALRPWDRAAGGLDASTWRPIGEALPEVPVPEQARALEIDATLLTQGTQRLVESALDSYRTSSEFYTAAAEEAEALTAQLRRPADDETVGLLVSDRHDNIGMDSVARAVADAGGATFLMDGGDDTSTGSSWEAFSLESLAAAFEDYEHRFLVTGNHDHGDFIPEQADRLGFTSLVGEVEEGPDGIRLLGVGDPRSSGLGNWREETGLSFAEVADRVAEAACAADEDGQRVSTLLVHDANLGGRALERGCVDLVVGGHLHVVEGPDRVEGENGRVGYSYTTASTGGAAYAIAVGTKPRRDAVVSLVTYREGRPVGVQWVSLSPRGRYTVGPYTPLPAGPPTLGPLEDPDPLTEPLGVRGEGGADGGEGGADGGTGAAAPQ